MGLVPDDEVVGLDVCTVTGRVGRADLPLVTTVTGVVDQCYITFAVLPRIWRGVSRKSTQFATGVDFR